jgi:hypothetical protein
MSEHTPPPWYVGSGDDYYIWSEAYPAEFQGKFKGDDLGSYLATVGNRPKDFGEANAALIVRAVNSHAELVKALTEIKDLEPGSRSAYNKFARAQVLARKALAKVQP